MIKCVFGIIVKYVFQNIFFKYIKIYFLIFLLLILAY